MKSRKIATCIFAICLTISLAACTPINDNKTEPETTINTTIATETIPESSDTDAPETSASETDTDENTDQEVSDQHMAIAAAIEKVIASQEHAMMQEVVDTTILKEFFLIDTEDANLKEIVAYQCPMSAMISEIIVIQADDVSAAKDILEARKTKLIEQDAFYPQDVENAEASIVDTCGNFAYFVINNTSSDDAELLNTLLTELA